MSKIREDKSVLSFEQWKKKTIDYLDQRLPDGQNLHWLLGGDDDMRETGYNEGDEPDEYVERQIEDAAR